MTAANGNEVLLERVSNGDKSAEDALVRENMGLVAGVAKRFVGRGQEFEDLMQMGCIGLLRAARSFDTTRGTAFSTYAVPYIAGEIKRFFRDDGMIKVSREVRRQYVRLLREKEKLAAAYGEEPGLRSVCETCGIKYEDALLAVEACGSIVSLDEPVGEEDGASRGSLIADESGTDAAARLIIKEALGSLDGREKAVLWLRGLCGMTQVGAAKRLGMTQATVSRTEKKARKKLKEALDV